MESRGIERMAETIDLPCCFALKSKRHESYLRYVHEDGDETTYRQLQLNGEDAVNPFTRFDSEPSLLHEGLVHIRCRYNRKYWVPRQRGGGWWIAADAHESEEDLYSANCTLIKPIITVTDADANDDDDHATTGAMMTVRFLHAGQGKDMRMTFSMDHGTAACMRVLGSDDDDDDGGDAFTVLNLSSSPRRLPRFVVFKGDNNLYLRGVTISGRRHLQFSARDPGDPTVVHEVTYPHGDDRMHLRNIHHNMMWGFRSNDSEWVLANIAPNQAGGVNSLFRALHVTDYFAFRPASTATARRFLKRITGGGITDCLNAGATNRTITTDARIRVGEPVLDREIFNVEYRLREARTYDTTILTMATTAAVNDTSMENTKTLTLAYEESELSTWDATLELRLGFQSRIRAGFPKLGLGATVNISAEFFGAYNWGETMEKNASHEVEYEVTVPPNTKVTVSLIATRSALDVPFNYQQRDIMSTDGKARVVSMTDGLYTGVNSYNFKFQTTEEKLKPRLLATTPP